jgi:hypothetical protein
MSDNRGICAPDPAELSRRQALRLLGAGGVAALTVGLMAPGTAMAAPGAGADAPSDPVAAIYYRVLLRHTRWAEQQFDPASGVYSATDFSFAVVLGNAVLLTRGAYDAQVAGVDKEVLRAHTIATIKHFAASNRVAGGTQWGRTLFFDTTFQSYFILAARLLWSELDAATQANVDRIAREQAAYTAALGAGNDPASGGWTPNGLAGGHVGDTKLEEMGVYAQSLAPALAWSADDPRAPGWRQWFGTWSRNEAGLPAADLANPRTVDGTPIAANTATNLYDTFIVENHGSFGPHYQEELWRTSGRNSIHFLTAGQPLPEVLTAQPNGERLWRSILAVMSDSGEPLMPMVADREHLYGRDVIPLAFRAQVLGDPDAARGEAMLADRLEPYQGYPPADRITKFSGEPKYEPEARAELAISYLLHEWRARHGAPVRAATSEELFAHASGVLDFGPGPGLLTHQSPTAWAATVSKPGFVKFAWQPRHDDWLFVLSGATPMLLPSTALTVRERLVTTYTRVRDGFDGSVGLLRFDSGTAAMATLPTGTVVYATSGVADGEGALNVHNLAMPGVPGLDGSRTYTAADATATVPAQLPGTATATGRVDTVDFARTSARFGRMLGEQPDPAYGYSLFSFEVSDGATGADLARGKTATASSQDTGKEARFATDGDQATRWAVAKSDRGRADSWLAVDLGAPVEFDRVVLRWEAAAGRKYRIETSPDATTWTGVAEYPTPALRTTGGWLDVDGRAGVVVRGSANPIAVYGDRIVLSDGPVSGSAGMVVEGYPDALAARLAALAKAPQPLCTARSVRTSTADGFLTLINLASSAAQGTVSLPQDRAALRLYRGDQVVTSTGTDYTVAFAAAGGRIEPPRFTLRGQLGRALPVGLRATVTDAGHVKLTTPAGWAPALVVLAPEHGVARPLALIPGRAVTVVVPEVRPYPLADLALGAVTFPADPLPAGMSAPGAAVDDDASTGWRPGPAGRMVVDLGAVVQVSTVELEWAPGRVPASGIEVSGDGRDYTTITSPDGPGGRTSSTPVNRQARFVAVRVSSWRSGDAVLRRLSVPMQA